MSRDCEVSPPSSCPAAPRDGARMRVRALAGIQGPAVPPAAASLSVPNPRHPAATRPHAGPRARPTLVQPLGGGRDTLPGPGWPLRPECQRHTKAQCSGTGRHRGGMWEGDRFPSPGHTAAVTRPSKAGELPAIPGGAFMPGPPGWGAWTPRWEPDPCRQLGGHRGTGGSIWGQRPGDDGRTDGWGAEGDTIGAGLG